MSPVISRTASNDGKAGLICRTRRRRVKSRRLAGEEADKLEKLLGVAVLRHKYKKPQGGADELEKYFG